LKIQLVVLAVLVSLGAGWFFLRGPGVALLPDRIQTALGRPVPGAAEKQVKKTAAPAKPAAPTKPSAPVVGKPAQLPAASIAATEPAVEPKSVPAPKTEVVKPEPAPAKQPQPAVVAGAPAPAEQPADPSPPPMPMPTTRGRNARAVADDVDRAIQNKLMAGQLSPSPLADDAEFMRRAYLDLTGKIPTYQQAVRFLDSRDPNKRARLIEELLASSDYGRHFAQYWIDLLVKRDPENNNKLSTGAFQAWLADGFNKNRGWDKIVVDLLTAKGSEESNPATFFMLANQDNNQPAPNKIVGTAGVLFMGIQMQCAECHVHPITSKWNRQDFWGMAAFFSHTRADREQTGKKSYGPATVTEVGAPPKDTNKKKKNKAKAPLPGAVIEFPNPNDNKKTDGTAKAKYFEGARPQLSGSPPYRQYAATWLTSARDPYFAPAFANRMWSYFFARGFVNPIDDMHDGNPASHPELLKLLAADFVKSGYDVKNLIRSICNSQTYQRTSRAQSAKEPEEALVLFSRMPVKVMTAEQLVDSVAVVTGHEPAARPRDIGKGKDKNKNKAAPSNKPASVAFFDTRDYDEDPAEFTYGVPQLLRLMNSYLGRSSMEVAQRVATSSGSDRRKAIETLYLNVLSRRPREEEVQRMLAFLAKQPDATRGYASAFWALINSAEFICNR
jgi:hypothetical protein